MLGLDSLRSGQELCLAMVHMSEYVPQLLLQIDLLHSPANGIGYRQYSSPSKQHGVFAEFAVADLVQLESALELQMQAE